MIQALSNLESDRFGIKTMFHVATGVVILFAGNQIAGLPIDLFYAITKIEGSLLTLMAVNILRIATIDFFRNINNVCLIIANTLSQCQKRRANLISMVRWQKNYGFKIGSLQNIEVWIGNIYEKQYGIRQRCKL